jgi:type II secretory pathway component PulF
MESFENKVISRKQKGFAWGASLFVSLCCIYVCVILTRSTGIFRGLFKDLGVELPLSTRFLVATYSWLYPLFFVGAAILVIAKDFLLRDMGRRLATTAIIFVIAISSVAMAQYVLNLPLLDLVQKLSQTK